MRRSDEDLREESEWKGGLACREDDEGQEEVEVLTYGQRHACKSSTLPLDIFGSAS